MINQSLETQLPLNQETEQERDYPSEILTQICATYPFLNESEYNDFVSKATNIEEKDPVKEISALIGLLNNPHAFIRRIKAVSGEKRFELNPTEAPTSEVIDNTLYMKIPTFSGTNLSDLENAFLEHKDTTEGIIIDLRENKGGSEYPAKQFAEKYFVKKGQHKMGTNIKVAPEGEKLRHTQVLISSKDEVSYDRPIVILTSNKTFSSAERFIAGMKAGTDCTIIGQDTGGGSANPIETEIDINGEHYRINIPTWRFILQGEEKPLEETKIKPDIYYDKDDIVSFAVKYIKTKSFPQERHF